MPYTHSHEFYVIGTRPSGEAVVLSTHTTRDRAELRAVLYREHLEGYAAITVEENGESNAGNRLHLRPQGDESNAPVPAQSDCPQPQPTDG